MKKIMIEIRALASGSSGNCYWISDGKTPLLLEAGIPIDRIRKGCGFRLNEIQGCLVSHSHGDHAKSAKKLMEASIDCYMSKECADQIGATGHRLQVISSNFRFIGTWLVQSFPVVHDCEGALGFAISQKSGAGTILYITDTAYVGPRFLGITHLMVEANFDEDIIRENVASGEVDRFVKRRTYGTHLSIQRVEAFLRANDLSQLREVHLLHLSNANSDAEAFKRKVREITGVPVYIA
jgi:phosphoribosyl 1,2-cyclic phosphodiesterase